MTSYAINWSAARIIPPKIEVGVVLNPVVAQIEEIIVPAAITCAPTWFTWEAFCKALAEDTIEATLLDKTFDNVQLNLRLIGSLYHWQDHSLGDGDGTWVYATFGTKIYKDSPFMGGAIHYDYRPPFFLFMENGYLYYDDAGLPQLLIEDPQSVYAKAYHDHIVHVTPVYGSGAFPYTKAESWSAPDQTLRLPGLACTDAYEAYYSYGTTLTEAIGHEFWISTNPDATNAEMGYSGVTALWRNKSSFTRPPYVLQGTETGYIDEYRIGLIDADYSIDDVDLPVTAIRNGLWIKKEDDTFRVLVINNGAAIMEKVLGYAPMMAVAFPMYNYGDNPRSPYAENADILPQAAGEQLFDLEFYIWLWTGDTDTEIWDGGAALGFTTEFNESRRVRPVCMYNVKWGSYLKPSAGNAGNLGIIDYGYFLTDPSYVLGSSAPVVIERRAGSTLPAPSVGISISQ